MNSHRYSLGGLCVTMLACSVLVILGISLHAAEDETVSVLVRCERLQGRPGARIYVLQQTPMGINPVRSVGEPTLDESGECRVNLPPGDYAFEVAAVKGSTIIALRTPIKNVSKATTVEVLANEPMLVQFDEKEEREVRIEEFAVRSASTVGEIKWTSGESSSPPVLVLSPGQMYRVRALGSGDNLRFAIWQQLSKTKTVLRLRDENICHCTFAIRKDGPAIEKARVRFRFPDGEMAFPVDSKTVFLTNRRFLSFGYGVELANGRRIVFRPWLGIAKPDQKFQLGGPFQTAAWAKVMVRKPVGGPETQHLVWDANLYDATGHMVLVEQSQIDWRDNIRSTTGHALPLKRALTKEEVAGIRSIADTILVDVSFHLEEPISTTLKPERFRAYGDRRFYTSAPPHWELQALNYLARAERVFHLVEDLERKPSKHRVQVRWHNMNGTAWGCGPAGSNAHIIMPFSGLAQSFDYYDSPWALAHEMLHTFGYGHGEKMNMMSSLVGRRFEQYRWFMADHPELDPETAFVQFRLATRVDLASTNPATTQTLKAQAMKKKKGKGKGKGK